MSPQSEQYDRLVIRQNLNQDFLERQRIQIFQLDYNRSHVFISHSGPQLEKLMGQLRTDLTNDPPLPGSFNPRRGELCAAKFSDGEWYVGD